MIGQRRGIFITIDGPGGVGKSTTCRHLHRRLVEQGYAVHATTEPSRGQLGAIARQESGTYTGYSLACLVAADRYHHLAAKIRPHLDADRIVVCDRYVASSYVLQRMDGVPVEFIATINSAADIPDLAVILSADPTVAADRIERRGAHSRFEDGITTSRVEADLYRQAEAHLIACGYPLLTIDTNRTAVMEVTASIIARIAQLPGVPPARGSPA